MAIDERQLEELKSAFYRFRRTKMVPPMHGRIKPSGMMLLMSLKDLEEHWGREIRVSELGKLLHLAPSTISLMLKEVEKANLIERYSDQEDKRRVYVRATKEGMKAQAEAVRMHEEMLIGLAEYLGQEDTQSLIVILHKAEKYFAKQKEEHHTC